MSVPRHYVLTRSYRSPDYPLDANRRRIEITRRITAASLAVQGTDWEWIVYIDATDPLLAERLDAFAVAGVPIISVPIGEQVEDYIDWSGPVLTTRIDDDDAFARNAFRRLHKAVKRHRERTVFMFPAGYRVNDGAMMPVRHGHNAWSSLYAPLGDRTHIRRKAHMNVELLAPITVVDNHPAWLWVRHQDAETAFRRADRPISKAVQELYAVNWDFVKGLA